MIDSSYRFTASNSADDGLEKHREVRIDDMSGLLLFPAGKNAAFTVKIPTQFRQLPSKK